MRTLGAVKSFCSNILYFKSVETTLVFKAFTDSSWDVSVHQEEVAVDVEEEADEDSTATEDV